MLLPVTQNRDYFGDGDIVKFRTLELKHVIIEMFFPISKVLRNPYQTNFFSAITSSLGRRIETKVVLTFALVQ